LIFRKHKSRQALSLLSYDGINPYIRKLKKCYLKKEKLVLTENQTKYIMDNHQKAPMYINRVLNITKYLGDELQKQHGLNFTPERLLVEFILAETEKTFHVYGKLTQKKTS
jgi:hypothetical protein